MVTKILLVIALSVLVLATGCAKEEESAQQTGTEQTPPTDTADKKEEPDYITVQHILVGFEGTVPGKNITRNQVEAKLLAEDLFKRVQAGEDFDELVKQYSDDKFPGIYKMANFDVPADMSQGVFSRGGMVRAFGDVGFPLEVGGVGLAEYDPATSQFGWHIIKRVE